MGIKYRENLRLDLPDLNEALQQLEAGTCQLGVLYVNMWLSSKARVILHQHDDMVTPYSARHVKVLNSPKAYRQ